jgi:hypothetical protein
MSEEVKPNDLPTFEEVVIMTNEHRMALQGLSLTVNELYGALLDLSARVSTLLDAVYETPEEPIEATLVEEESPANE